MPTSHSAAIVSTQQKPSKPTDHTSLQRSGRQVSRLLASAAFKCLNAAEDVIPFLNASDDDL